MISLKRSIEVLDELDRRDHQMHDAYCALVQTCERAVEILADDGQWRAIAVAFGELRGRVAKGQLDALQRQHAIEGDYLSWLQSLATNLQAKEREYKQIVLMVTEAAVACAAMGTRRSGELHRFATQIETVSKLSDIVEIRMSLEQKVEELVETACDLEAETQEQAENLRSELKQAQQRVLEAELNALTDPVTGLGNRRHAEIVVADCIENGGKTCLIEIDLDGFKEINDTYGHAQGDQLLKLFGRDLRNCLREGDRVCRWGGDEFLVILADTDFTLAGAFVQRIRSEAFGPVVLSLGGKSVQVPLGGSVGVAQYTPGETPEEFVNRTDQLMYADKRRPRR